MVAANEDGYRLDGFSCSLQQKSAADDIALHRTVRAALKDELGVLAAVFAGLSPEVPESLSVNGAGAFEVGGPEGDNGLSGKDFFKVDRAGALHARRVAKAVVMTGAAEEAFVRIGWFPGDVSGRLLSIEGKGGNRSTPTLGQDYLIFL